jgi:tape measure domain-containing protein
LSGLNSALGTLSNISNVIQGIPVIGKLIDGAMSFATGPIKDMAQLGLGFNDLKENATLAFSVILKDGEKAKKLFEDLAKFGKQSPIFKTGELITFAQQLLPILGPGPELFDALKGIGAVTSATGRMDRMSDIFLAFTQIARKPKLSSEEMSQQLAEAGVDSWGLLARGLGRTPGEVMELSKDGRLSGIGSFKVMMAQALREYGTLPDLMAQTRTGKQAVIDDTLEQLAARATQNLHGTWKGGQDRILQGLQGPQGAKLAGQIDSATGVVGNAVLGGFDALLDGSLLNKAQEAAKNVVGTVQSTIQGAGDSARQTMQGYASSLYEGFASFWEIKSPSERAKRLGQWIKEGLELGLTKGQAQNYARMKWASEQDPNFIKSLVAGASQRGINPDDMLNLIAVESGFQKAVMNPWGYGGLGQVGRNERKSLGLPGNDSAFQKLLQSNSESWQLMNVLFPFLDMKLAANPRVKSGGVSLAELYAMWGSGHATGNPNAIHMAKGGKRAQAYANNPLWDVNKDGVVRESEFGQSAMAALGAGRMFSVNGAPITNTNPMPVSIIGFVGENIKRGAQIVGDSYVGENIKRGARIVAGTESESIEEQKRRAAALGQQAVDQATQIMNAARLGKEAVEQSKGVIRDELRMRGRTEEEIEKFFTVTNDKVVPGLEKLGETAQLTAEQIDANRKLAELEGAAKKKKRDPLFDAAFTREGIAGDFHGGLSSLLGNLGWGGSAKDLGKQFLFNFARDAQARIGHDISSMLTGSIFGQRGEDGNLTGGLFGSSGFSLGSIFSKLFGGLFGGFRAGGGSMSARRFYVAGENGRELIAGPGHVYNNRETEQIMGGGGSDPHYTIVAIGDREIGRAVDAYRSTPRGRRARLIEGRYGRKLMAYA